MGIPVSGLRAAPRGLRFKCKGDYGVRVLGFGVPRVGEGPSLGDGSRVLECKGDVVSSFGFRVSGLDSWFGVPSEFGGSSTQVSLGFRVSCLGFS